MLKANKKQACVCSSLLKELLYLVVSVQFIFYFTEVLQLPLVLAGTFMTLARFFDAAIQPVIAYTLGYYLSQKKKISYILCSLIFAQLILILLLFADFGLSGIIEMAVYASVYLVYIILSALLEQLFMAWIVLDYTGNYAVKIQRCTSVRAYPTQIKGLVAQNKHLIYTMASFMTFLLAVLCVDSFGIYYFNTSIQKLDLYLWYDHAQNIVRVIGAVVLLLLWKRLRFKYAYLLATVFACVGASVLVTCGFARIGSELVLVGACLLDVAIGMLFVIHFKFLVYALTQNKEHMHTLYGAYLACIKLFTAIILYIFTVASNMLSYFLDVAWIITNGIGLTCIVWCVPLLWILFGYVLYREKGSIFEK